MSKFKLRDYKYQPICCKLCNYIFKSTYSDQIEELYHMITKHRHIFDDLYSFLKLGRIRDIEFCELLIEFIFTLDKTVGYILRDKGKELNLDLFSKGLQYILTFKPHPFWLRYEMWEDNLHINNDIPTEWVKNWQQDRSYKEGSILEYFESIGEKYE